MTCRFDIKVKKDINILSDNYQDQNVCIICTKDLLNLSISVT